MKWAICKNIVFRESGDEFIAYNTVTNKLFLLNETACVAVKAVSAGAQTVEEVSAEVDNKILCRS